MTTRPHKEVKPANILFKQMHAVEALKDALTEVSLRGGEIDFKSDPAEIVVTFPDSRHTTMLLKLRRRPPGGNLGGWIASYLE